MTELIYLSCNQLPLTNEAALLTRLMLTYNNIEQLLAVSELTGLENLDLADRADALAPVSVLARLLFTDLHCNLLFTVHHPPQAQEDR